MVVSAKRWGEERYWRRSLPRASLRLGGHTTTQPSSIEEDGFSTFDRHWL